MLSLRNATEADLGEIRRIYEYAQDYMIRSGNPTQWGHFYPSADLIRSDIQKRSARGYTMRPAYTGYLPCLMARSQPTHTSRRANG